MEQEERLTQALADRYRIEREIGSGGMATVYLAEDLKHHRKVAVKVLRPELTDALGAERFLREIEVAANLIHPHILPVFDSGEADGFLFYVMPYVRGGSLKERLREERQLPIEFAVSIAREMADALAHAHEREIVHRDVKPANILLTGDHALLADFGVAQALAGANAERLTQTGISVGTPAYMSPEQAAGEGDLNGRSDQYALGCVLYEMLAGQPPFTGPTGESVMRQHLTADPPSVTQVRPSVPAGIAEALTRALAKNPADRFRTAVELSLGLTTLSRSAGQAKGSSMRRWIAAAGLAVLALMMVAVVMVWRRGESRRSAGEASGNRVITLPYDNETGDPALDPIGRMVAEWITEGLAQTGEVQIVPNLIVMQAITQQREIPEGPLPLEQMARVLEAGIAVAGSYYQRGDSLEFHSTVVDVESAVPLGVVEPTRGPVSDPMEAIEAVRGQVMGVLGTRLSPLIGWELPPSARPPSFEASQAYTQAMEAFVTGRYGAAARGFQGAYALDTTYLRALLMAAGAWGFAGRPAVRDSLLKLITPRRQELAPYDRLRTDLMAAELRGDRAASLALARQAAELVPVGTQRYVLVGELIASRRPAEALASLEPALDAMRAAMGSWFGFWDMHTGALHLLGEHQRELEVAAEGRRRIPNSTRMIVYESRALAALGRVGEVMHLASDILAGSDPSGMTPAVGLLFLASELKAHGQPDSATALLEKALAWFDDQPGEWRSSTTAALLHGELLYARERWEEAGEVFASLADDASPVVTYLGYSGVIAARLGDADAARSYDTRLANLEQPFLRGSNTRWRARIAALVGEPEKAVSLLEQAMREGLGWGRWVHTDMDLEPLRGYPPFVEFMTPVG